MQQEYRPPEGANLFDLVLRCYASLNLLPRFIADNKITDASLITKAGEVYFFDDELIRDEVKFEKMVREDMRFSTSTKPSFFVPGQIGGWGGELVETDPSENYLLIESGEILATESNQNFIL